MNISIMKQIECNNPNQYQITLNKLLMKNNKKYTPTTKEIEKWCGALRSGKYKQGKNRLFKLEGTYCCLGVGCRVMSNVPRH